MEGAALETALDVCYSAKIGILKQITTDQPNQQGTVAMFVTLQR